MKLFLDANTLLDQADKLGQEYTDKYCPYKPGDLLIVKPQYGQRECVKVQRVRFDQHSELTGFAILYCEPWVNDWSRPKDRRASVIIKRNAEIVDDEIIYRGMDAKN